MTVAFVTAIYNIHEVRSSEIWNRLSLLADQLPLHIVCSAEDKERIPVGVVPFFKEFNDLQAYKCLEPFPELPKHRNVDKDTKAYMILMNAKAECLQIVKNAVPADHYIWIDAGISKIFKDPVRIFNTIKEKTTLPLRSSALLMPGCWRHSLTDPPALADRIAWRFAGGFFIVPAAFVDAFASANLDACAKIGAATGAATWEVNVWCLLESSLPIQWEPADHNETIIQGLDNYKV